MSGKVEFLPGEIAAYYRERAPKIKQTGSQWRGPCPIHEGSRDSFAVEPETGTWFCHSKCGRGGSLIDLEMEVGGKPFAEAASDVRALIGRPERESGRRVVATYPYHDENGTLLFECVRYDPKGFTQRRPDGQGGWTWNLRGVKRVLFRLGTLKDTDLVVVVEGEKDTLTLAGLGFVATCNPMGAGKWREEYSDQLAGKHVLIFPDNDEPGQKHAREVEASLAGKAASVRIGRVPVGKDVTEWIQTGATRIDVEEAIKAGVTAPNEPSPGAPRTKDWGRDLLTNEFGAPRAVLANAITALRLAPEWDGVLGFNEFSLATVALKAPPWPLGRVGYDWTDHEDRLTADWLQHQRIFVSVEIAGLAVQTMAKDRSFHPVRQRLDSLKWDGTKRIDGWLSLYLGVAPGPYVNAIGARWLISAVARVYEPGVKADCALILEGEQGLMKSTALKALAEPWFTDEIADLGSKDAAMQTRGVWLIEIAELDSMSRAEVSRIKSFISRATDRFRPPYGKRLIESPRQCVFAGSVNHSTYLRDETGGRRFWPVACTRILIAELRRDRDQLWAEAVARYRQGEKWWLDTPELINAAEEEQADRYEGDAWDEPIAKYIDDRESVSVEEILRFLDKPVGTWTQSDKTRVARSLKASGWERYKAGSKCARQWRYRPRPVSHSGAVSQSVSHFAHESGSLEAYEM